MKGIKNIIFGSNAEKLTDRAFKQSIAISVVGIILCMVALCSTTFAWFTVQTENDSNKLLSGSFNLKGVEIYKLGSDASETSAITVNNVGNGDYSCELSSGTYKIVLRLDEKSTAKGHCIVEIGSFRKHTQAMVGENAVNKGGYVEKSTLEFTFVVTAEKVVVKFRPVWGVHPDPFVKEQGVYSSDDWK